MILIDIIRETAVLGARMAPYLLLGFAVAGVLRVLVPVSSVVKHLGSSGFRSVVKAAVVGIPLPLCSCGVIGPAVSLRQQGASKGAVLSFLISTPTSGVDSILATYSLLGWIFTAYRVAASFVLGAVAGLFANLFGKGGKEQSQQLPKYPCPVCGLPGQHKHSVVQKLKAGTLYALDELPRDIGKWLLIGLLAGGVISALVSPDLIRLLSVNRFLSYIATAGLALPLYVCATGSIPIAAALVAKGLSPGAALIFLIAGPATNTVTAGVVAKALGKKTLVVYLSVVLLGSLGLGALMDLLGPGLLGSAMDFGQHGPAWWEWLSAGVLGVILLLALARPLVAKFKPGPGPDATVIRVPDMSCQHCVITVERAVSKIEGVKSVKVDLKDKSVLVSGGKTQDILQAISEAGYTPQQDQGS